MKKFFIVTIAIIAIITEAVIAYIKLNKEAASKLISQVSYLCNDKKTIDAAFYKGKTPKVKPGEPPTPNGKVSLVLSDDRKINLPQTISASGIRYANNDESFIFWSKGDGAFILENNEQSYIGCIALASDPGGLPKTYANGSEGFSIRYPNGYSVNESYIYQALGPGKDIGGIKFTVPAGMATGTNLSGFDTGVSIEEIPDIQNCNASLFVSAENNQFSQINDNGIDYSVASSIGAAAGNIYEEKVWAIPETNPCIAIRYFIHSTNIDNYTPGTIEEFNKTVLLEEFDKIRKTLIVSQ